MTIIRKMLRSDYAIRHPDCNINKFHNGDKRIEKETTKLMKNCDHVFNRALLFNKFKDRGNDNFTSYFIADRVVKFKVYAKLVAKILENTESFDEKSFNLCMNRMLFLQREIFHKIMLHMDKLDHDIDVDYYPEDSRFKRIRTSPENAYKLEPFVELTNMISLSIVFANNWDRESLLVSLDDASQYNQLATDQLRN